MKETGINTGNAFAGKFIDMNICYGGLMKNLRQYRDTGCGNSPAAILTKKLAEEAYENVISLTSEELLRTDPRERTGFIVEISRLKEDLNRTSPWLDNEPRGKDNFTMKVLLKALELREMQRQK